jgi:hypothetical protein
MNWTIFNGSIPDFYYLVGYPGVNNPATRDNWKGERERNCFGRSSKKLDSMTFSRRKENGILYKR